MRRIHVFFRRIIMWILVLALFTGSFYFRGINVKAESLIPSELELYDLYDTELEKAIIAGSGTEDDPYIVDYANAPYFEEFVLNSLYQQPQGNASIQVNPTGFTGLMLTVLYDDATSGVWVYSSGGLPVTSNGNIRFSQISYNPNFQVERIKAIVDNNQAWLYAIGEIESLVNYGLTLSKANIEGAVQSALLDLGITALGGFTASQIASAVALLLGAVGSTTGKIQLVYAVTSSAVNSAYQSEISLVDIYYLTAYNGAWYANSVTETGWSNDAIYLPADVYGTGSFH